MSERERVEHTAEENESTAVRPSSIGTGLPTEEPMHRIVVGVDGSDGSMAALRFAVDEARLRRAVLEPILVWTLPEAYYAAPFPVSPLPKEEIAEGARATLETAILSASLDPEIVVRATVTEGSAAEVLVEAARGADLLVVGSRGHGSLAGVLLGSVSSACVYRADCPVAVVHRTPEAA